jgi:hypothetical protein
MEARRGRPRRRPRRRIARHPWRPRGRRHVLWFGSRVRGGGCVRSGGGRVFGGACGRVRSGPHMRMPSFGGRARGSFETYGGGGDCHRRRRCGRVRCARGAGRCRVCAVHRRRGSRRRLRSCVARCRVCGRFRAVLAALPGSCGRVGARLSRVAWVARHGRRGRELLSEGVFSRARGIGAIRTFERLLDKTAAPGFRSKPPVMAAPPRSTFPWLCSHDRLLHLPLSIGTTRMSTGEAADDTRGDGPRAFTPRCRSRRRTGRSCCR